MKPKNNAAGIAIFTFLVGAIAGGLFGMGLTVANQPVLPVASNGDPATGEYPRTTDDDKVLWALVTQNDYPQIRAYTLAFKEQFPELVEEFEANSFSDDEDEIKQTGINVCFDLDDTTHGNKEPIESVYHGDDVTKKRVVNLAIDILCPTHLSDRY